MDKFEQSPIDKRESAVYCPETEKIAFQAAEMSEFQEIVKRSNTNI